MLAKKTSKNQITLPKAIADQLPGVEYFDVTLEREAVVLRPVLVRPRGERLAVVRAKVRALGLSEKSVADAVRWARRGGR